MSVFVSDGDPFAGWKTGRWFGLAGVVAGIVGAIGYSLNHSFLASSLQPSDQMFAAMIQWVGGGLFALMALCVVGSIKITREQRGGVAVAQDGVRRIYGLGREVFFPREEIAGLVPRPMGGVVLVDRTSQRQMIIPRSLDGYRDCIDEIKALGIETIPARKLTWPEKILNFAIVATINLFSMDRKLSWADRFLMGMAVFCALFFIQRMDRRRTGKATWVSWFAVAVAFLCGLWRP
jgi:hypothetical protein